jgi:hypothetical protein
MLARGWRNKQRPFSFALEVSKKEKSVGELEDKPEYQIGTPKEIWCKHGLDTNYCFPQNTMLI